MARYLMRLILPCLGALLLTKSVFAQELPLRLPAPPTNAPLSAIRDPRVPALIGKIRRANIFSAYRELIEIYERDGYPEEAARLYRAQASLYHKQGLTDAAVIHEQKAAELESDLQVFVETPATAKSAGPLYTGASLEPVLGCYSGAFIDRDDNLGEGFLANNQLHRRPGQFEAKTGRNPASLFIYLSYGRPFPSGWVRELKAAGVIPHIAWEPKSLALVQDDAYLRQFASDLRAADWPVFIRFASEMNGAWTPYHGNPALYRQKFRLVHKVLHEHSPLVATIWCVNNPPLSNGFDYYPGDDGCDWVGVNFYSVPWFENQRNRPAFRANPLALLDPIYRRYAQKKPIAICEYAASHQAALDRKIIPEFAVEKLSLVYGALPLLYPRVKMINWFDMNTMAYPVPGKTLNNYLLTDHPTVLAAWQRENNQAHYLTRRERLGDALPPIMLPLQGRTLGKDETLRIWTKTHTPASRLWLELDGKLAFAARKTGAFTVKMDHMAPGSHRLRAFLYDDNGKFRLLKNLTFNVR